MRRMASGEWTQLYEGSYLCLLKHASNERFKGTCKIGLRYR